MLKNKSKYTVLLVLLMFFQVAKSWPQTDTGLVNRTVLKENPSDLIPLKDLSLHKIAVVLPDLLKYQPLAAIMDKYSEIDTFTYDYFEENVKLFNTVIAVLDAETLSENKIAQLQHLQSLHKDVIVLGFGTEAKELESLGMCYLYIEESDSQSQANIAMTVFGGLGSTQGIKTAQTRLQYTYGRGSSLDIKALETKIESIAAEAISGKAAPGMVVMVVKNGQVIIEKAFGSHTYSGEVATHENDIFDLASISKIAGTTPVIMNLYEQKLLDLDSTMGNYLWQAKGTNKEFVTLRSVMLHEAGFTPYIPFYRHLKPGDLLSYPTADHQTKVADSAYLINDYYRDVMWPEMLNSDVKPIGNYVYSDISMYVMQEVAENLLSRSMDEYIDDILYKRIGMKTAGYNPRERFEKNRIVPTELDTTFRKVLLQGYVHDQGAAMAGGVAGHAGLFASANDLAIYAQMLLNRGKYGGVTYFKPETVDLFTSKQSASSRRGLGFDRADPDPEKEYPSRLANNSVYGHTGYTGTCIWIDPKHQLTYIFLSNRVHPQVSTRLYELNIRSRIYDAIYETINGSL